MVCDIKQANVSNTWSIQIALIMVRSDAGGFKDCSIMWDKNVHLIWWVYY